MSHVTARARLRSEHQETTTDILNDDDIVE